MSDLRQGSSMDGRPADATTAELAKLLHLRELTGRLQDENQHLATALETRVVIEQAKGMLAERLQITLDQAFAILRHAARSNRVELRKLAAAVVTSPTTPPEVEQAVRSRPGPDEPT
jgi:ANTAR domain